MLAHSRVCLAVGRQSLSRVLGWLHRRRAQVRPGASGFLAILDPWGFRRAQVHPEASPFPPKAPSKTLAEAELVREAAPIREPPPLDRNPRWDATGSSSQATALRQINQSLRGCHKSR